MHLSRSVVLAAALFIALATPVSSSAYSYAYGSDRDEGDGFGWAIVSGGNSSMSDMQDLDSMDDLKSRFGDEFLYVRGEKGRYVITDPGLVERAQEGSMQIRKYGKEIGEAARAQARLAVGDSRDVKRKIKWRDRSDRLTASEKRALTRRREEASERLHESVRRVNREMREILREAKSRGLAEPVER